MSDKPRTRLDLARRGDAMVASLKSAVIGRIHSWANTRGNSSAG